MRKIHLTAGLLAAGLAIISCAEQLPDAKTSEAGRITPAIEDCLAAKKCPGKDLRRLNLRGANLNGADLSSARLNGVILIRAILSGANLSGADLTGANLSGANLIGADLQTADLENIDLSGANLEGANFGESSVFNVRWSDDTICPNGQKAKAWPWQTATCCDKWGTDEYGISMSPDLHDC